MGKNSLYFTGQAKQLLIHSFSTKVPSLIIGNSFPKYTSQKCVSLLKFSTGQFPKIWCIPPVTSRNESAGPQGMAKQLCLVHSPPELPHLHTRKLCPCQCRGHVLDHSLLLNYLGNESQHLPPKQDVTFTPVPFIYCVIPFSSFLACDIFYFSIPTLSPGSSSFHVDQSSGCLWKRGSPLGVPLW